MAGAETQRVFPVLSIPLTVKMGWASKQVVPPIVIEHWPLPFEPIDMGDTEAIQLVGKDEMTRETGMHRGLG